MRLLTQFVETAIDKLYFRFEHILDIGKGRVSISASDCHLVKAPAQACVCETNLPFNPFIDHDL